MSTGKSNAMLSLTLSSILRTSNKQNKCNNKYIALSATFAERAKKVKQMTEHESVY